jgi:phage shock protein C
MKIRKSNERVLAGVCGGMARQLGVSSLVVRAVVTLATVITGFLPGMIVYTVLTLIMAPAPPPSATQ